MSTDLSKPLILSRGEETETIFQSSNNNNNTNPSIGIPRESDRPLSIGTDIDQSIGGISTSEKMLNMTSFDELENEEEWSSSMKFRDETRQHIKLVLTPTSLSIFPTGAISSPDIHEPLLELSLFDIIGVFTSSDDRFRSDSEFTRSSSDGKPSPRIGVHQALLTIIYLPKRPPKRSLLQCCKSCLPSSLYESLDDEKHMDEKHSRDKEEDDDDDGRSETAVSYMGPSTFVKMQQQLQQRSYFFKNTNIRPRMVSGIKTLTIIADDQREAESWKMKILLFSGIKRWRFGRDPSPILRILVIVDPLEQQCFSHEVQPVLTASRVSWRVISTANFANTQSVLNLNDLDCIMIVGGGDVALSEVNDFLLSRSANLKIPVTIIPTPRLLARKKQNPVSNAFCDAFLLKHNEDVNPSSAAFLVVRGLSSRLDLTQYFSNNTSPSLQDGENSSQLQYT